MSKIVLLYVSAVADAECLKDLGTMRSLSCENFNLASSCLAAKWISWAIACFVLSLEAEYKFFLGLLIWHTTRMIFTAIYYKSYFMLIPELSNHPEHTKKSLLLVIPSQKSYLFFIIFLVSQVHSFLAKTSCTKLSSTCPLPWILRNILIPLVKI